MAKVNPINIEDIVRSHISIFQDKSEVDEFLKKKYKVIVIEDFFTINEMQEAQFVYGNSLFDSDCKRSMICKKIKYNSKTEELQLSIVEPNAKRAKTINYESIAWSEMLQLFLSVAFTVKIVGGADDLEGALLLKQIL